MEGWRDGGMEGWRDGGVEDLHEEDIDTNVVQQRCNESYFFSYVF